MSPNELVTLIASTVLDGECPSCRQSGYKRNPDCMDHYGYRMSSTEAYNRLVELVKKARGCHSEHDA